MSSLPRFASVIVASALLSAFSAGCSDAPKRGSHGGDGGDGGDGDGGQSASVGTGGSGGGSSAGGSGGDGGSAGGAGGGGPITIGPPGQFDKNVTINTVGRNYVVYIPDAAVTAMQSNTP